MIREAPADERAMDGSSNEYLPPSPHWACLPSTHETNLVLLCCYLSLQTGGLFDPLGFSKDEGSLYKYRAIELKHGRIAMVCVQCLILLHFIESYPLNLLMLACFVSLWPLLYYYCSLPPLV